ncbi:phage Gp37/Gp68 family protein [Cupriavidus necator]
MSENSKIEWTDHTFNPWEGCQKVGPGCDHCYAETRNARFAGGTAINWGPGSPRRRTSAANWRKPLAWNAQHEKFLAEHGRRQRVFCSSLADVFDNAVAPEWREDLLELIFSTPNLDWLLLTKRVGNVLGMVPADWLAGAWPAHVWLGATIVNQAEADRDIPKLLEVPAPVRFLSMEPLLGPVALDRLPLGPLAALYSGGRIDALRGGVWGERPDGERLRITHTPFGLDWVIVGGESGPGARPMHPDWARGVRDQCAEAFVPFLFKQWGEWLGARQDGSHSHDPIELNASDVPVRVGKKAAGRLLDGVQHDGFPIGHGGIA